MEQKILEESYKERIKALREVGILEYLQEGFNLYQDSILKAIEHFKSCMPIELKGILLKQDYWDLYYNKPMVDLIVKTLNLTAEEQIKAVGTFVYTYQSDKRDFEELEEENLLREKLFKEGFKEQDIFKEDEVKNLNGLKVICVMDISRIDLWGSFDKKEQLEGKLIFNNDNLYLMPKRSSKKGFLIKKKFYYKEIK